MYQIENSGQVIKQRGQRGQGAGRPFSRPVVSRTVILLGLTSLFSDISSEMVETILPRAPHIVAATGSDAALVLPAADLALAVVASSNTPRTGDALTFTLTVTNHGAVAASDVRLGGALPAGMTFGSFGKPAIVASDGYSCTLLDGFASCAIAQLQPGASWTNTFTVTLTDAGTLTTHLTALAIEPDPTVDDNRATLTTLVAPGP